MPVWRALACGELSRARRVAFELAGAVAGLRVHRQLHRHADVRVDRGREPGARESAVGPWRARALGRGRAGARSCGGLVALAIARRSPSTASCSATCTRRCCSLCWSARPRSAAAAATLLGWAWTRGPRARAACLAFVPALIVVALLVPSARAALAEVLHGLHEWFADSEQPARRAHREPAAVHGVCAGHAASGRARIATTACSGSRCRSDRRRAVRARPRRTAGVARCRS